MSGVVTELRALIVEDEEDDLFATLLYLEKNGYKVAFTRVEDAASMRAALADKPWDIVLSDWSLPRFSGREALELLRESGIDIPFIIVSGTVGEATAVDAMLAGARDYIVKGQLGRLGAAIERELKEHDERSARQRAESTLARTEKLRALGRMAAGVAHDLENILNPLSLQLQVAQRALESGASTTAKKSLAEMHDILARGVYTLERLRSYSRQSPESERLEVIDLDRLMHEATELAKHRRSARGGRIPRIVEHLGAPPSFPGHPNDVLDALVNLILNAIHVLTDGGTVTLRTGKTADRIWAEVADDGPGLSAEVKEHLFVPFITTKGDEGTGLGLPMVYACMQRHGGSVNVESAEGKGTTFTLSFPTGEQATD